MAQVNISKWEVAEMFGLTYIGELENNPEEGYYEYHYLFQMNSKEIAILQGMGDSDAYTEEQAKEKAAEKVLSAIGKLIVL